MCHRLKKGKNMKNINKFIKKFFEEKIEKAEMTVDSNFKELFSRHDYDTAKVMYFSDFCENYPDDVLDFIDRQGVQDEKRERLCELMLTKISNDSERWLKNKLEKQYVY